jgi:hypothetical protein
MDNFTKEQMNRASTNITKLTQLIENEHKKAKPDNTKLARWENDIILMENIINRILKDKTV